MNSFWLDFGGGDAEYCECLAGQYDATARFVCLDPLLRVRMIEAGRLRKPSTLPANVTRMGGGLGPSDACTNMHLPFRDSTFQHVIARFVFHLYLSALENFASEAFRVLIAGGDLVVRVPNWLNAESAATVNFIIAALTAAGFTNLECGSAPDENVTLWDEIYEGRAYTVRARKPPAML